MAAHAPALLRLLLSDGLAPSGAAAATSAQAAAAATAAARFSPASGRPGLAVAATPTAAAASRVPLALAALVAALLWGVGPVLVFAAEMVRVRVCVCVCVCDGTRLRQVGEFP